MCAALQSAINYLPSALLLHRFGSMLSMATTYDCAPSTARTVAPALVSAAVDLALTASDRRQTPPAVISWCTHCRSAPAFAGLLLGVSHVV